jgi:ABC-type Mn2+/Zn2+ transport system permease subunit
MGSGGGILVVVALVGPATLAAVIARSKGRSALGFFVLGCLSSVVGLAIALVVPAKEPGRAEPGPDP